jgi:tRNA threonylcarbamoyladenosine biosynthesis protein TsaE
MRISEALLPVETRTPDETKAIGAALAARLSSGDVVALYGDLGAGKTHLVKGIAAALGVPEESVNSPTFTLVNEYTGRDFPLYHFDAYRIRHLDEFFELGYEDYFFGDGLCLIEWPERIEPLLPPATLRLRLSHLGEHRRRIEEVKGGNAESRAGRTGGNGG